MRRLLLLAIAMRLGAQETTAPADTKKPDAASQATSPVPSTESWLTGSIDFGYRWRTDVAGSFDAYRSIVNLGSGPKLMGTDFTVSKARAFDRLDVRTSGWGGEPYSTFNVSASKAKLYDFRADYRD